MEIALFAIAALYATAALCVAILLWRAPQLEERDPVGPHEILPEGSQR